jgi:trimeric autotransporter adhesin
MRIPVILLAGFVCVATATAAPRQETAALARVGVATPAAASEGVPRLVQFSGALKDAAARPVTGVASVTFAIYAEQDGGAALWSETQNVLADSSGHYSLLLGAATASGVPAELFGTGQSRWLGVTVARQPELPRVLLASVPYALKAGDADTLGGLPASAYVTTQNLAALNAHPATTVVSGGTSIIATGTGAAQPGANSGAATAGYSTASANSSAANAAGAETAGASGDAAQNSVTQAAVTGTGTAQFVPLWTSGSNLGNSKLFQATNGYIGVNTTTPQLQLDVTGNSIFRGSVQLPPQGTANASSGQPSRSFQWEASLYDSSKNAAVNEAFGFRAVPATNNVSGPAAKFDLFYGPGGGTLTDLGLSIGNTGVITFVPGQTFGGSVNLPASGAILLNGSPFISGGTSDNAVFGVDALPNQAGSEDNVAVGQFAMVNSTNSLENVAVGTGALPNAAGANGDVAIGFEALEADTTAVEGVAVGDQALYKTSTGNSNVAVGPQAGYSNTTGSQNTFLGPFTDTASPGLTNATAIGAGAYVTNSDTVVVGSIVGVNSALQSVHVGIGTTTPGYALEVDDTDTGPMGHSAIYGITPVPDHNGIIGAATANNGGSNGGYFTSASPSGAGLVATNTAGGLAASLQGDVQITGKLTKGGGSFKIDDPIDPAGKYLSHSFVESPDMMNIYNGNVVLDAHGRAVIEMPKWFGALNRDFRYQLTAIGAPGPKLYVAEEMHDNHFKIAGGKAGMKVSWMVTGIRQDAWANANRIPTEEEKPADQQGRYLHPELFGAGPEKSVAVRGGAAAADFAGGGGSGAAGSGARY